MEQDGKEPKKVSVAVRIRPRLESRGEKYEMNTVKRTDANVCVCVNPNRLREQSTYCFDYVLDEDDNQEEVYKIAAADIANSSLEGTDNVILTYGQTGSGKTYTLLGTKLKTDGSLDNDSGIFLRVLFDLLAYKETCKDSHHLVIALSIIEIYNDQLRDLLNNKQVLNIKEQGDDAAIVNPTVKTIGTKEDVNQAFDVAISNRAVAPTLMNDTSSRSHAMFIVDLLQQRKTPSNMTPPDPTLYLNAQLHKDTSNTVPFSRMSTGRKSNSNVRGKRPATPTQVTYNEDAEFPITRSTLTMVDLAGSERAKKSGAQGAVLQEAVAVNKSLTSLGKVVNSLHTNSKHVPFRESKLTRLLRSSLVSGLSRILLITNIAPTDSSYNETASSLHFADRLQELKAPQGGQYKVGDSEMEVEYLKYLRVSEELGSEIRLAQTYFPNFSYHLKNRTLGQSRQEKNYRALTQSREEEEKRGQASRLRQMVAALVANLEAERPGIAENKKKLEALTAEIDEEETYHKSTVSQLSSMQEELSKQEKSAMMPHNTFVSITAKAEQLSTDLKKATLMENQLTVLKILDAKKRVEEMEQAVAKLEDTLKNPEKAELWSDEEDHVPVDKGVSPLAWRFDGLREGVKWEAGTGNGTTVLEALKRRVCDILQRIADAKMCYDDDGRQLFGILSQVRVTQGHLACISAKYAQSGQRWSDSAQLIKDCSSNESVSFAVRSFILFPTATTVLDKGQDGGLEVLEFVELLLKEWQSTGTNSGVLKCAVSAHP